MLYQPSGRKGRSPQRHTYTKKYHRIAPSPPVPRPSGVKIVGSTTEVATHTHNLAEPLDPNPIATALTRARHRDGVYMPDAGLHPHQETMHKQHTEPVPSCCVPFGDPHVHKVTPSGNTRQHEVRQGDTHDSGSAAVRVPLAQPAKQNWRWPSEGEGTTIVWAVWIIMNHWGVSS